MSNKGRPRLDKTSPVLETVQFRITDGPLVSTRAIHGPVFRAEQVVVEKRERGTRFVVKGHGEQGPRSTNFNMEGYPYPPVPGWLLKIWEEVRNVE